ncbi:hypothetical protein TcasGA2_TC005332 [Tribolium castaneum]|uniref:Uncharacterized protein n=1 Tax=Tribolium castaneum TaxID=7070 RepID=D6WV63_TRICA|nr:hypothetical protein TcasGA2_TC005332 [Tribolium castaneum]
MNVDLHENIAKPGGPAHSLGVTFLSTMVKVKVCAGEDWGVEEGDDDDTVTVGGWG